MTKTEWIETMLSQFERKLVNYAFRIVGDEQIARDIAQDSFMKLWQQEPEQLTPKEEQWLFRVCRNLSIDHLRRQKKLTNDADLDQIPAPHQEGLEEQERRSQVIEAVDRLSPKHREVLHLKYRENMSYQQISDITGHSVSNVGYLLHEAVKQLKTLIASEGAEVAQ